MASLNRVTLIGNLGQEPVIRTTNDGATVASFSVATTDRWHDKNTNEPKEATEWHRVVCFRGLADIAKQILHKGSKAYIEGKLTTRKWQDSEGRDIYTTEIIADKLIALDKNQNAQKEHYSGDEGYGDYNPPAGY